MDKRVRIEPLFGESAFRRISVLPLVIVAMGLTPRRAGAVSEKLLSEPPDLVLMVVVDQMRADFLRRHYKRFLPPDTGKGRLVAFLMEVEAFSGGRIQYDAHVNCSEPCDHCHPGLAQSPWCRDESLPGRIPQDALLRGRWSLPGHWW